MKLKSLIIKQSLEIDDHHWGAGEIKQWDNAMKDVHLDKSTHTKVEGKHRRVRIKVPINSDREITIVDDKIEKIPLQLRREILGAFENRKKRDAFILDIIRILKNFESSSSTRIKAKEALSRIARHFELPWDKLRLERYYNDALKKGYQTEVKDEQGNIFRLAIDGDRIVVEDTFIKKKLK